MSIHLWGVSSPWDADSLVFLTVITVCGTSCAWQAPCPGSSLLCTAVVGRLSFWSPATWLSSLPVVPVALKIRCTQSSSSDSNLIFCTRLYAITQSHNLISPSSIIKKCFWNVVSQAIASLIYTRALTSGLGWKPLTLAAPAGTVGLPFHREAVETAQVKRHAGERACVCRAGSGKLRVCPRGGQGQVAEFGKICLPFSVQGDP